MNVELARRYNKGLSKITINPPIPVLVGISQRASRYMTSNAEMIKLRLMGSQTNFNVTQAFAKCQLRECHAQILIKRRKCFRDSRRRVPRSEERRVGKE